MTNTYEKLEISEETVDFIADVCRENYELKWDDIEGLFDSFVDRELDAKQLDIVNSLICDARRIHRRIKGSVGYDRIVDELEMLVGDGGGNLSYDFYLKEDNLLIEYQGEFHDGSDRMPDKSYLPTQQEHDRRKREYAEQR